MKNLCLFATVTLLLLPVLPLQAQIGCTNSPENPTAMLALVGSAGAFVVAARVRLGRRK